MGTNRTRRARINQSIKLDESLKNYLLFGEKPERHTPAWETYVNRHFEGLSGSIRAAWHEHRAFLIREWRAAGHSGLPWAGSIIEGENHAIK